MHTIDNFFFRSSFIFAALILFCVQPDHATAQTCDYYASPNGTGNGKTQEHPFRIIDFWFIAKPGKTLCLLEGEYTGKHSMIKPPTGLKGTAGFPITIRAEIDGTVNINGQNNHIPVHLQETEYIVVEGINAHHSKATVVMIRGRKGKNPKARHNTIRRVCAWDAKDGNTSIFGAHWTEHTLFEDCAGWGIARKIYSSSQAGNHTTLRRCWGRWEGSHVVGPTMTYTMAYKNYNMTIENCIGTWSGEKMLESYTVLDYSGNIWKGPDGSKRPIQRNNYSPCSPVGIFAYDRMLGRGDDPAQKVHTNSRMLGCLAYVLPTDQFAPTQLVYVRYVDSFTIKDVISIVAPSTDTTVLTRTHAAPRPFLLDTVIKYYKPTIYNLRATGLTGIGTKTSFFKDWQLTDHIQAPSIQELKCSPFNCEQGAQFCFRYVDGGLTQKPLWPWPMNDRIKKALIQSDRNAVDVTQTVETLLGPIPDICSEPNTRQTPALNPGP